MTLRRLDSPQALHGLLRIACAMCFVGHGAWGLMAKPEWLPFFRAFGIPDAVALPLMPLIGAMDITLGLSILVFPTRLVLVWMFLWTLWTALLRPITGLGWWEFLERGGNYGPPLAFLFLAAGTAGWLQKIRPLPVDPAALDRVTWTLRASIAFLLIGHGGFGAFQQKAMLVEHWAAIGITATPVTLQLVGWLEIAAGVLAFWVPAAPLLVAIVSWKIATELLYPIAGRWVDAWEWVERGGDYAGPLALAAALALSARRRAPRGERAG